MKLNKDDPAIIELPDDSPAAVGPPVDSATRVARQLEKPVRPQGPENNPTGLSFEDISQALGHGYIATKDNTILVTDQDEPISTA